MGTTRRSFLRTAAIAGGALALPACASRRHRGPMGRDEPINIGVVGVGGRGRDNLMAVRSERVVALCDVDRQHLAAAQRDFPSAKVFVDFRELVQMPGLDAVVISTPDHTHHPVAMFAVLHELDIYCEKPLAHTVAQARRMATASREHGLVTQMGIQIHANANYRRVVEAIRGGAIGAVREVLVFVNGTDWSAAGMPPSSPVPEQLDWDLWLGPAAERPYSSAYHPAGWRRYWAFGGGTTADMACHYMDLPFWALDLDAPRTLQSDGPEADAEGAPAGMTCDFEFDARGERGPVRLRWWCGNLRPTEELAARGLAAWSNGVLFVGERGWLISNYDQHELGPAAAFRDYQPPPPSIESSPGHHLEWLRCCRDRKTPTCSFDYGGPLTETVNLANVAYRAARGRRLQWDAAALAFRGDDFGANLLLDEPRRHGFDI
jgi:predicted dehydrogenase